MKRFRTPKVMRDSELMATIQKHLPKCKLKWYQRLFHWHKYPLNIGLHKVQGTFVRYYFNYCADPRCNKVLAVVRKLSFHKK